MVTYELAEKDDVAGLVVDRFAKQVDLTHIDDFHSILRSHK
jgi:hypothetical protein